MVLSVADCLEEEELQSCLNHLLQKRPNIYCDLALTVTS